MRKIINKLVGKFSYLVYLFTDFLERNKLEIRWFAGKSFVKIRNNNLIISLTSYPPRFGTLHLTIKSLLMQSMDEAKIILWIADDDISRLPKSVTDLEIYGLEIKSCRDLKSYKKLIPSLEINKKSTIITADDDISYSRDWAKQLVNSQREGCREVICHRMHRINLLNSGLPMPYRHWEFDIHPSDSSELYFPTGIGGVLYPPGIFPNEIFNAERFLQLCPRGDDIWFYWMARSNGAKFRWTGVENNFHCWNGSQDAALWKGNVLEDFNDTQITNMIKEYGFFEKKN